jgi:hypothetical protein
MRKITLDLVKLIKQAVPQISGSVDPLLLQQWLRHNIGTEQVVTIDLATAPVEDEAEILFPPYLQPQIRDITVFSDASQLRIQILVPAESSESQATTAYYGLLAAIADL